MSSVVIVGCGFPQLSLIRAARRRGLRVVGADRDPRAIGVALCDEFHEVSTADVEGLCALVNRTRAEAITTTGSEVALRATAHAATRLRLPFYADPETVRMCQDKDSMRTRYAAAGLDVPKFARCAQVDDAMKFAHAHGYPLVVKPSRGWGQRGVARVESDDELACGFDQALTHSRDAGLELAVVEEWLEGREYSVNGWIEDGSLVNYCVTERLTIPGRRPLGVMAAEVYPSGLTAADEERVIEEARRGAAALGHTRGPCYSQVAFARHRCVLFETAARMGGGFDADVTRLASGVDLYDRVLGVAVGDRTLERQGATTARYEGAIAKFLIGKPGRLNAVRGLGRARAVEGVDDVQVFVPVGGHVMPLTDSAKRAGYALAHGTTREQAMTRANEALAQLSLDTSNIPTW